MSERKNKAKFDSVDSSSGSNNHIKNILASVSNKSKHNIADFSRLSNLFKRKGRQADKPPKGEFHPSESRKSNSLSGFYEEIKDSSHLQKLGFEIRWKEPAVSQKRTLFNLKANFNRKKFDLSKLKNDTYNRVQLLSARKQKEDFNCDREMPEQSELFRGFKFRHDFNQNYEPNWRSLRVSTTKHKQGKLQSLSFVESNEIFPSISI